ncbi:MerR family transcriptional regulator [Actinoplanes sp. GCM10030250]|uniref:MerR family transcriptional regulator n=1 Tax=Actinoplanes sp. GCM10030250 TaxID=3273376 RepID=UPI0036197129
MSTEDVAGGQQWRIGELARVTGVTVRTLHHYDRVGLLAPSTRTAGGHRCYTGGDVRRLHAILALRGFGLSLAEISRTLDGADADPRAVLRGQLDVTDERIRRAMQLRARLLAVLSALDRMAEPSASEFITLIEEMIAVEAPLTPEQFAELGRRRQQAAAALTDEERAEMNRRRQEAMAALSPEEIDHMQRERARWTPAPT